jgi:hypothetical protein
MQGYYLTIKFIQGELIVVADALSRIYVITEENKNAIESEYKTTASENVKDMTTETYILILQAQPTYRHVWPSRSQKDSRNPKTFWKHMAIGSARRSALHQTMPHMPIAQHQTTPTITR